MIEGIAGAPLLLALRTVDRASGLYPRVSIVDAAGVVIAGPFAMTEAVGSPGLYLATWPAPTLGAVAAVFDVFTDAFFTVLSDYDAASESVRIVAHALDETLAGHLTSGTVGEALALAFANGGGHVRDDALVFDVNDRPTSMRRRVFANAAAAAASTPGGTGEGEIMTITVDATHVTAAQWQSLLRRRTA